MVGWLLGKVSAKCEEAPEENNWLYYPITFEKLHTVTVEIEATL